MIRLAKPAINDVDVAQVEAALRSGLLVQGERVAAFEAAVRGRVGTAHAIATSSGTAALHLTLLALDIGPGDEVAVPCYSWPATANVVVRAGAEPVFVDIDEVTFTVDIAQLEQTVAEHPKLKAVMPVHAFGMMADMPSIHRIARSRGLKIIEDAACALGVGLNGRMAGSWGDAGCFSFHPRKVVTTGEGGMVTTDDSALEAKLRELRNHGLGVGQAAREFVDAGLNYRLTEFQGALGLSQLTRLDHFLARRQYLASRYAARLEGTGLHLPPVGERYPSTFQTYVALLPEEWSDRRGALIDRLRDAGVEAAIGTHHIPLTAYYRQRNGYRPGDFPITDRVSARALALPMHAGLTEQEQDAVAEAVGRAMVALARL